MAPSGATCDVAIIGAGPAGATLAYKLLQGGLKPVLIDKAVFPRGKVCGGGLTFKALKLLPTDLNEVRENEICQVELSFGLRQSFTKSSPQPLLYTVERKRLDTALVDRVRRAGGEVIDGECLEQITTGTRDALTIVTSRRSLKTRVVVGADGARSTVARSVGLKPVDFFHLGLQGEVLQRLIPRKSFESGRTIFLDMGSFPDGYAWGFPRGNLLVLGVMGLAHRGKQLKEYCAHLLAHLGLKQHTFPLKAHLIPHRVTAKPIVKDRVLLVGDAAGLTDFWTGEGICFALASAHFAGRQILKFFQGDAEALNNYQVQVDREITPELQASYQFSRLFNYLGPLAFRFLGHYDYPWEVFCRIMRGDRSFVEIKKRFRPNIFLRKLLVKSARNQPLA
ncbi:MAG: NAD(P)/FAD-dependent oxidoreductase [Thermodesulfobacteriota bacterium]